MQIRRSGVWQGQPGTSSFVLGVGNLTTKMSQPRHVTALLCCGSGHAPCPL